MTTSPAGAAMARVSAASSVAWAVLARPRKASVMCRFSGRVMRPPHSGCAAWAAAVSACATSGGGKIPKKSRNVLWPAPPGVSRAASAWGKARIVRVTMVRPLYYGAPARASAGPPPAAASIGSELQLVRLALFDRVLQQRRAAIDAMGEFSVRQRQEQRHDRAQVHRQQQAHGRGVAPGQQRQPGQAGPEEQGDEAAIHGPLPGIAVQ